MARFVYDALPGRVVFGDGTLEEIAGEVERLSGTRALILCTRRGETDARRLEKLLGSRAAGIHPGAVIHTPVEVTDKALEIVRDLGADCLVAIGGGSTTGLAKALALKTGLPQIAVPTTYAGSEVTPSLGQTEKGRKTTIRDMKVLPETVIYDVSLTMSLLPAISATSGMNAIAHAVEALYAQDRNPVTTIMAREGIRALIEALPVIVNKPGDRPARAGALYGAWLCGTVLGSLGMALHHKLCHTLGGSFDLPHSETHTVILPHAAAFNAQATGDLLAPVAEALGAEEPGQGLYDFAKRIGAPTALKELGMPEDGLDEAAGIATENPYWNPRPVTRKDIRALLDDAWHGRRPAA